jgi:hypothetical protein
VILKLNTAWPPASTVLPSSMRPMPRV